MTPPTTPDGDPPLFLLGAPRSGTTALYKALCLHPEAGWLSNWERLAPRLAPLAAVSRIATVAPTTRRRVWFGADGATAYAYGRRRGALDRLFPQPVEGEPVFTAAGVPMMSESTSPTGRQAALAGDVRARLRWGGRRVFVSKRIAHNTRVALLHALFPGARFVVITRDGRAVASSLARVDWWEDSPLWWWDGRTPRVWAAEGREPVEACARHWIEEVTAIERGLQSVPAPQVMRLAYEDFVRDSPSALRQIARFSGLGVRPEWTEALSAVRFPDQNDAWRERLGPAAGLVEDLQGTHLRRLGYT